MTDGNVITSRDAELAHVLSEQLKSVDSMAMGKKSVPVKVFKTDPLGKGANAYYWPKGEDDEEHYAVVEEGMTSFIGLRLPVEISIFKYRYT